MTTAPIALSCGEPAGVGPEITAKAWQALKDELTFFWIGDPAHLPADLPVVRIPSPDQASAAMANGLPVISLPFAEGAAPGQPSAANAFGVIQSIEMAVEYAQSGAASAVCTNPINKKALKDGADFAYPGHTEFLAALGGVDRVVMMLACDALRVVPATIHIPVSEVPKTLTKDLLEATIRITRDGLIRDFGISDPRLAIMGLNPHAGEGGAMGHEELDMIIPLLDRLRAEGLQLTGPHPADTAFHAAARAKYDAAVAMYHDQALIPIKTLDFAGGVNVTLGLPFIRTSPDHGTAFDIAGKGQAEPTSLIAALRMAQAMALARGTA
ncbi:4-hydroxythreonine-4-phosphate dehydrogenase PdxA [Actibacterium pelagium]|uniref:4-hydroxythreonine-4-phosphate dehydrogenase n=1 Tax=Actibacterium pelagium TaxID=2029103 RepID=A0A917EJS8_9RHOB|nr:4-hydroxythreonine-4-phosphate dehydrogenase PdxA [Actibacterium pelagium]GGE44757.1 4-hydroxythreonine-4-phosphate dehydrogenase [Actibacterium pelagium]